MTTTQPTTIQPTTGLQVHDLDPRTLLVDVNVRHDAQVDREFIASVRDLGVLVPIVAVRTVDRQVRVRFGHRRTLAAIEAGHATVPVLVAADEGTDDVAQVERLVGQYAENEHRTGLTGAEQVGVIAQLSAFGVSAAQIAKRTHTSRKRVDTALVIAGSTLAQAAVARYGDFLDLTQAAVVAEVEDDAEAVKALVAAARTGQFDHVAQRIRDERTRQAVREGFAESLRAQAVRVLERNSTLTVLRDLTDPEGAALTTDSHAACPGHAVYVDSRYGYVDPDTGLPPVPAALPVPAGDATGTDSAPAAPSDVDEGNDENEDDDDLAEDNVEPTDGTVWSEYPTAVYVCTDPAEHGHRSQWGGYSGGTHNGPAAKPKLSQMSEEQAEASRAERRDVIASNKAWTASTPVRREFLRALLTRKTPPKGSAALIATALASDADVVTRIGGNHLAGQMLGCEAAAYGRSAGVAALIEQATDARAQVLTLALVLCGYEDDTHTGSWRSINTGTRRYLGFLGACGYTLSNVERRACGQDPLPDNDAE